MNEMNSDLSIKYNDQHLFTIDQTHPLQNFILIWLDESLYGINDTFWHGTISKLHEIINNIYVFSELDQCIDFITDITKENVFVIVSDTISEDIISIFQEISQITSIYIYSKNNIETNDQLIGNFRKIKGTFTDTMDIWKLLKKVTVQYQKNLASISFIEPNAIESTESLDRLDSSFMYTQIMKEILLTIQFTDKHLHEFTKYCREQSVGNVHQLKNIDHFENTYHDDDPIWWYSNQVFIYSVLNRALRNMEVDIIIKMGFFLRDLHESIVKLHHKQYDENNISSFVVYRGQGLSKTDFERLLKSQDGLMSFNNFLSTSKDQSFSLGIVESILDDPELIGILFQITVHPLISSTVFADIREFSQYPGEEEILFSMHSIFRIEHIEQINNNDRLWQVNLTLTTDNDRELNVLTEFIRKETFPKQKGWYRMGQLLIKCGKFNMAEDVFKTLLGQTTDKRETALINYQLIGIYNAQGNYIEAIRCYEKAYELFQSIYTANHPILSFTYAAVGFVYENMGDYAKALSFYEKDLAISEKIFPSYHRELSTSYNNIALLCDKMGEYLKALSYYEKALRIREKIFPSNHPDLASTYNNIGKLYYSMGQYPKALSYYEKVLNIREKILPPDHPSFEISYSHIGLVYRKLGQYTKALSYYKKSLAIAQKNFPNEHPSLATAFSGIGSVYEDMNEYSTALSYYEKDLAITEKCLPPNHPDLATTYNNLGLLCDKMGDYSKAMFYHKLSLDILKRIFLPKNIGYFATYNNIGGLYVGMNRHSEALPYLLEAIEIAEHNLPPDHMDLVTAYDNIGFVYDKIGNQSEAFIYFEKSLNIRLEVLASDDSELIGSYSNVGLMLRDMKENVKALSYFEKALQIAEKILSPDQTVLANLYNHICDVYINSKDHSKAFSYFKKLYEIHQKIDPSNHPKADVMYVFREYLKRKQ